MSLGRIAFWGTVALAVGQILYYRPQLPDRVATHFAGSGQPNGWQSADGFLYFDLFIIAIMAFSFGVLPAIIGRMPSLINIPNRDYWLAPERRIETLVTLGRWMQWMGAATMIFIILVLQQVIDTNLHPPPRLGDGFLPLFVGYLALIAVALISLIRRFRLPPTSA